MPSASTQVFSSCPTSAVLARRPTNLAFGRFRRIVQPEHVARWNSIQAYDEVVRPAHQTRLGSSQIPLRHALVGQQCSSCAMGATSITGATPEKYGRWLEETLQRFTPPSPEENLIFTNAWNEWAEGNHLVPDVKWGLRYLEEHARATAITNTSDAPEPRPSDA